jgi:signal transduction histidine kinase
VDGLVFMSGTLGNFVDLEELRTFCERYRPLPMISIALALGGIPSVLVDNEKGMRDAISHLIEVHGYRRIAFIRGPAGHQEAEARYRAYTEMLAKHGLPLDPDLIAPGDFTAGTGLKAIQLLLDERKVDFEAVVAANDPMALGALEALQARGIRVPGDVAVVGFDDIAEARLATPPLTTVRQPLHEQGRRAAEMVLALLAGEEVPKQVTLPTELVVRQSCGCFSQAMRQAWVEEAATTGERFEDAFAARREHILSEMVQAVGASYTGSIPEGVEQLLNAFSAELKGKSPGTFVSTLDDILRQVAAEGGDVASWQAAISALRRHTLSFLADDGILPRAENLWQQARVLIGEAAQRAEAYQRLQAEQQAETLRDISQTLMTTFNVGQLMDVVAQELPRLGVRSCYISLYDGEEIPAEWSRLILAYDEGGRVELETGGRRFPSRQLVPDGISPRERRYAMALEPLYFRDDVQFGFALFELLQEGRVVYEMLGQQISTALRGALLFQERKRAEERIEHLNLVLSAIRNVNQLITRERDRARLLQGACEVLIETRGYHNAWVALLDESGGPALSGAEGLVTTAEAGWGEDFLPLVERLQRGQLTNCVQRALTQSGSVIIKDPFSSCADCPLSSMYGNRGAMTVRMEYGEKVYGLLSVSIPRDLTADEEEQALFEEVAGDIAFALHNVEREEEREQAEEALKEYSERLEEMVEERTQELRETQEQLIRKEKLAVLGQMAGGVGHELRNPLGAISNAVYFLSMVLEEPDPEVKETLEILQKEVKTSEMIINSLLDFARAKPPTRRRVNINDVVQEALSRTAVPENVEVVSQLDEALPIILADPDQLAQVFGNLILNAIQAMPEGGQLVVKTSEVSEKLPKSEWVAVSIADTGVGIPEENLGKLFEPLFTTKAKGVGLGLAVVKSLVDGHGGTIEVESETGVGTTFTVRLPISVS